MRWPKKFDLVHQTVSPHERVESGDETNVKYSCIYSYAVLMNP